jgi:hypothetical protein
MLQGGLQLVGQPPLDLGGHRPREQAGHQPGIGLQGRNLAGIPVPHVDTLRAGKVEIRCDRIQPVQFDGDTVDPTDRLDLEIDPSSRTLAVPRTPRGPGTPSPGRPD